VDNNLEERRVANEAICTLINIKRTMAELLLKPAGVPKEIYIPLITKRDEVTGKLLTKRQMAPIILDAIEKLENGHQIVINIIKLTSKWTNFDLADDEFAARATVQKAIELMNNIESIEAINIRQDELTKKKEKEKREEEEKKTFRRESELLLMMFDEMSQSNNKQQNRGFLLQDFLTRVFNLYNITIQKNFQRNEGAEQIDGAFKLEGWHYLVECRWRCDPTNTRELDGLLGQIGRSGRQTMGLFLSINGWSENVPKLLKQNTEKSILLMDGYDLRTTLARQIDMRAFINAKVSKLNLEAEPFFSVSDYLKELERR
jgi:hypothetical protein